MKPPLILFLLLFFCFSAFSQEVSDDPPKGWINLLHAEAGFTFPNNTVRESLAIRQNMSSYYSYQSSQGQITTQVNGFHAALRWEFLHTGKKIGFSTGIRYQTFNTTITGYTAKNADFFYLRYSSEGVDTKFARVKSITEANRYIGIPLEIRYAPCHFKNTLYYLKVGIEPYAYMIDHTTDIAFQDTEMEKHKEEVVAGFSTPVHEFTSTFYSALGISFNNEKYHGVTIEFILPSFFLAKDVFSLTENHLFTGFRASYYLPISH